MAPPARRPRPVPDGATLRAVVDRIVRVPDRFRSFTSTAADAARHFGIDEGLLTALTDEGLPCGGAGGASGAGGAGVSGGSDGSGGVRYDQLDLANASLSLTLPSARFMAMRGWSAALRTAAGAHGAATYAVDVLPACPAGAGEHGCRSLASAELRAQPGFTGPAGGPFTLTRQVRAQPAQVHPELAELTGLVADVHFHYLPAGLRNDVGFLRDARLGDCGLVATHLAGEASRLGLTARRSFGLFLSAPYSIAHSWLDVRLDGRWVSFDPHLLKLLTGWGLLPAAEWPAHRSIGEGAWRLADHEFVLATHDGAETPLSFPTRVLAGSI
ncbi:transglutaminase domain-containing protein [Kitasatospora sp. NPDC058201]|uniref:transglutaminase domain-containing protein n=1 Tax=unclassified Kitasatospora TaxID=2633591 RepID=UPI00364B341E